MSRILSRIKANTPLTLSAEESLVAIRSILFCAFSNTMETNLSSLPVVSIIFFTEDWLSSANVRISLATTAKPLPISPALAASILAFKDSRLVWEAIPSITFTISLIPFKPAFTSSIACCSS